MTHDYKGTAKDIVDLIGLEAAEALFERWFTAILKLPIEPEKPKQ